MIAVLPIGEVLFDGQPTHVALPVEILYLPAAHNSHVPPFGPVKPALQAHAVITVLEASEFEPVGQVEQGALPVVFLYVPVVHSLHVLPAGPENGPVKPMLQAHAVTDVLPADDCDLKGHAMHGPPNAP